MTKLSRERHRLTRRRGVILGLLAMAVWLLLACICAAPTGYQVTTTDMARHRPAWACPSDTPLPWGEEGPKRSPGCCCEEDCDTDPDTGEKDCDCVDDTSCYECRYYEWEQENGALGGPPFPAPTEYSITNDTQFRLGHLVNFGGGVDVQVTAASSGLYAFNEGNGAWEAATEPTSDTQMLQLVTIDFDSQAAQAMSFDPARQVVISGITKADGRQLAGRWTWDSHASDASGIGAGEHYTASRELRHTKIPSGTSQVVVPIFTPTGRVEIVDFQLDPPGAAREGGAGDFRVQFIDDPEPYCAHEGIPHWSPGGRDQVMGVAAPPGSNAIVQTAMQAVGHQYCWGGNGYEACDGGGMTPPCYGSDLPCWDCSGLTTWVYQQHGITLPRHSSGQRNLPAVSIAEIQPGDLLTFPGHVGLFAGDLDGDGTGDMIHAGQPDLYGPGAGIGIEKNVLQPGGHWRNILSAVTRPSK